MILEPNMYVRTDDGYIFQIKELLEKGKYNDSDNKIVQRFRIDGIYQKNEDYIESNYIYSDWVTKASHNIIDLIEIGDYVNGFYVEDVKETFVNVATGSNYFQTPTIYENDIKSIVTKEQFESMSYRIGE